MAARPRKKPTKACRLPEPLPLGFIVTDTARKREWKVGKEIGCGGFGRVYLSSAADSKVEDYVLKIEYHQNGPLFTEVHCYMHMGQESQIENWKAQKKFNYLGISPAYGFGSFEHKGLKYRFLVMQRYGIDLSVILKQCNNTLSVKNACTVAMSVLSSLEYIHNYGYLHCDIKAANLLLGRRKGTDHFVYLVDLGLALKYQGSDGHKKNVPDPKKAHNGTIEYMSRDAHKGTPCSRRSDLESLAFNLLNWLCGHLPWDGIQDCIKVQKMKEEYMSDIKKFMKVLSVNDDVPPSVVEFVKYVQKLEFTETPGYDMCRKMLEKAITSQGFKNDGKLNFNEPIKPQLIKSSTSSSSKENSSEKSGVLKKKPRVQVKKAKTVITLDASITPTPAMLQILNKQK